MTSPLVGRAEHVTAFVSYSHDSEDHRAAVVEFAQSLRRKGIDALVDRFVESKPPQSWPRWMLQQVRRSDYVLAVCTETYRRRVEGDEEVGVGLGARWEGSLISEELYRSEGDSSKFIPVVFSATDTSQVPLFLRGTTHYLVDPARPETFSELLGRLEGRAEVEPVPLARSEMFEPVPPEESLYEAHVIEGASHLVHESDKMPSAPSRPLFEVIELASESSWYELHSLFASGTDSSRVLQRTFEIARKSGARVALIEREYEDIDYGSEWSALQSKAFVKRTGFAERVHFFTDRLTVDDIANLASGVGYIGYVVLRPSRHGRVGRTLLIPPPDWPRSAALSAVQEIVEILGQSLPIRGVPFCSSDGSFGRGCAATLVWLCLFMAHVSGYAERIPIADITTNAIPAIGLPSVTRTRGLSLSRLSDILAIFRLPPVLYAPEVTQTNLPIQRTTLADWVVPYLRSGLPVIAVGDDHAQLVCGYDKLEARNDDPARMTYLMHDDDLGPYVSSKDQAWLSYEDWDYFLVPLPEDVLLTSESAEVAAYFHLNGLARMGYAGEAEHASLTSYLVDSNRYRRGLASRGIDESVRRAYLRARLPRRIWVVEFVDQDLAQAGEPCVLGEILYDATSPDAEPHALAVHVPGVFSITESQEGVETQLCEPCAYRTSSPTGTVA